MPTYGFELRITVPGMAPGSCGTRRMEIDAPDRRAAESMIDGWAAVEGKTVVSRTLLTDGETFREAGVRILTNYAAHLSMRYGATMDGPYETGDGGNAVRVTLPNGKGVSLKTGGRLAYDPAPTVEALAFDGSTWIGNSERSASVEWCASMLDDLK